MKKTSLLFFILLMMFFPVCLCGQPNSEWYTPSVQATTDYYDLSSFVEIPNNDSLNSQWSLCQLGSTMPSKKTITISPGDSQGFRFINVSNPSSTRPFTIKAFRTKASRSWGLSDFSISQDGWVKIDDKSRSFDLPAAKINGLDIVLTYYYVDFYIEMPDQPSGLEPGLYEAKIVISDGKKDYPLTLRGKFATAQDFYSGNNIIVTPTNETYSFNIRQNAGMDVPIADIHFEAYAIADKNEYRSGKYNEDSFSIGVSPSRIWEDTSSSYMFLRDGSQYQVQNEHNSVPYIVGFAKDGKMPQYSSFSISDPRLIQKADWVIQNEAASSSWIDPDTNVYQNLYQLDGTVSINVPADKIKDLAGGIYRTNIYFYVISNV